MDVNYNQTLRFPITLRDIDLKKKKTFNIIFSLSPKQTLLITATYVPKWIQIKLFFQFVNPASTVTKQLKIMTGTVLL